MGGPGQVLAERGATAIQPSYENWRKSTRCCDDDEEWNHYAKKQKYEKLELPETPDIAGEERDGWEDECQAPDGGKEGFETASCWGNEGESEEVGEEKRERNKWTNRNNADQEDEAEATINEDYELENINWG